MFRNVFVALINDTYQQVMHTARRTFKFQDSVWTLRGVVGAVFPPLEPRKMHENDDDDEYQRGLAAFVDELEEKEAAEQRQQQEFEEFTQVLSETAKRGGGSEAVRRLLDGMDEEKGEGRVAGEGAGDSGDDRE